jgi:hypothetical protein
MQKKVFALFFVFLCAMLMVHPQHALADFSETFLGSSNDGDYIEVWEGWSARFAFNMTAPGDTATVFNASGGQVGSARLPTHDETGFIPGFHLVDAANLGFTISSSDLARDTVSIRSGFYDGNTLLLEQTYALGTWWTDLTGQRKYADLSIDLLALGLGQYLQDGRFVSLVIAPDTSALLPNDFRIDMASMAVNVTPVPLPAAFWLFGSGLAVLAGARSRRRRRFLT